MGASCCPPAGVCSSDPGRRMESGYTEGSLGHGCACCTAQLIEKNIDLQATPRPKRKIKPAGSREQAKAEEVVRQPGRTQAVAAGKALGDPTPKPGEAPQGPRGACLRLGLCTSSHSSLPTPRGAMPRGSPSCQLVSRGYRDFSHFKCWWAHSPNYTDCFPGGSAQEGRTAVGLPPHASGHTAPGDD